MAQYKSIVICQRKGGYIMQQITDTLDDKGVTVATHADEVVCDRQAKVIEEVEAFLKDDDN